MLAGVIALAAANLVAVVLFGLLYAAAATRLLPETPFQIALVALFGALTALWLRVEGGAGRRLPPLARAGRIAASAGLALLAAPALVLTPLFLLHDLLPPGSGLEALIPRVMALLLIGLVLMVAVNVAGTALLAGAALLRRIGLLSPPAPEPGAPPTPDPLGPR